MLSALMTLAGALGGGAQTFATAAGGSTTAFAGSVQAFFQPLIVAATLFVMG